MKVKCISLAAGLLLAIALVLVLFHPRIETVMLGFSLIPIFGLVTVTYAWPVQSTTPPDFQRMRYLSLVTCTVNFSSDLDTLAVITHNFGEPTIVLPGSTGTVTGLSCLFPVATWYYTAGGSSTGVILGSIATSLTFQISRASLASMAGTLNVSLFRPHTGIR